MRFGRYFGAQFSYRTKIQANISPVLKLSITITDIKQGSQHRIKCTNHSAVLRVNRKEMTTIAMTRMTTATDSTAVTAVSATLLISAVIHYCTTQVN